MKLTGPFWLGYGRPGSRGTPLWVLLLQLHTVMLVIQLHTSKATRRCVMHPKLNLCAEVRMEELGRRSSTVIPADHNP